MMEHIWTDEQVADLFDAALAERDALRKALEPFAAVAEADIGTDEADCDLFFPISHNAAPRLTVRHFRAALAALSAKEAGDG